MTPDKHYGEMGLIPLDNELLKLRAFQKQAFKMVVCSTVGQPNRHFRVLTPV